MPREKAERKEKNYNGVLVFVTVLLAVLITVSFIRSQISMKKMREELEAAEAAIIRQELINKNVSLVLENDEAYVEKSAREDLDYAEPEERVFIVVP